MGSQEEFTRTQDITGRCLPPFGAELAARIQYRNAPLWVVILAGGDAWKRAQDPRVRIGDCHPLVWNGTDPAAIRWPVEGCACWIDVEPGPSAEQVRGLAVELLLSGAAGVLAIWSRWSESWPTLWQPDGAAGYVTADEVNRTLWPDEHARRREVARAA
jgi:hypothetical protein